MSERDPEVRADFETKLRQELARKEARICMLEAQLAKTRQQTAPQQDAVPESPPHSAPPLPAGGERPRIALSRIMGPQEDSPLATLVIARAAAQKERRNDALAVRKEAEQSANRAANQEPEDGEQGDGEQREASDYEPTARFDSRELRRSHRALAQSGTGARRPAEFALLGLGVLALWMGVWRLQAGQSGPQNTADQALPTAAAEGRAAFPAPISYVNTAGEAATPVSAPAPITADSAVTPPAMTSAFVSASAMPAFLRAMPSSRVSSSSAASHAALPPAKRHAFAPPARLSNPALSAACAAPALSARKRITAAGIAANSTRKRAAAPGSMVVAAWFKRAPQGSAALTFHRMGTAHTKIKTARLASAPGRAEKMRAEKSRSEAGAEDYAGSASEGTPLANTDYGLGPRRSREDREPAEMGSGPRRAPSTRRDLSGSVDHALETLDKMRALFDTMEQRRKTSARP